MKTLSTRLKTIADMIRDGECMADIGTDHGQLPVFLCEQGRCPKVIMTDVSEGSLAKARLTAYQYLRRSAASGGAADPSAGVAGDTACTLEARLGDGLEPLAEGEADVVVMAGIGGGLMERILSKDPAKSASMGRYILQPRRSPGELRRFLDQNGYRITEEKLVPESKFIWEIIAAEPADGMSAQAGSTGSSGMTARGTAGLINTAPASEYAAMVPGADRTIFWEIPDYYGKLDDPLMDEYLRRKLAREKRNLGAKKKAAVPDERGMAETERNIAYIESLIAERGAGA